MRLNRVSKRRQRDLQAYYDAVKVAKEHDHTCQKCRQEFWSNLSLDAHHPYGRTNGWLQHFILLCRECHDGIHQNPNEAYQAGWLQPEYKGYVRPDSHPEPWTKLYRPVKLERDQKPLQLRSAGRILQSRRNTMDWTQPVRDIAAQTGVTTDSVRLYMRRTGIPLQDGRKVKKIGKKDDSLQKARAYTANYIKSRIAARLCTRCGDSLPEWWEIQVCLGCKEKRRFEQKYRRSLKKSLLAAQNRSPAEIRP